MICDLKYTPGKDGAKTCWRFTVVLQDGKKRELRIEGWRFWPDSGDVKPPIIIRGKQHIWIIKIDNGWLDDIRAEVLKLVEGQSVFEVGVEEGKRLYSDEELTEDIVGRIIAGDNDLLNRFMNLTPERAKEVGVAVPTQADKEFVLRRLKEVVEGG